MRNIKYIFGLMLLLIIAGSGCKKTETNEDKTPEPATLNSSDVGSITGTSAVINASIISEGAAAITAKGVCWNTTHNPTITDYKTTNRHGANMTINKTTGISFTAFLTGLHAYTTYYARVYATNSYGTRYSNEITFITTDDTTIVTDIDGNVYSTVTIGTQVWMVENLKVSHYNDGSVIITGLSNTDWLNTTTGAYGIFNEEATNNITYGKLYNWYAVNTGKLAPAGWHVASKDEWELLRTYLGGESVAGAKMKSVSSLWTAYSGVANTNSSGFSGLPGGYRYDYGDYLYLGTYADWWSTTEYDLNTDDAWNCGLNYYNNSTYIGPNHKYGGLSVRCVKD